MKPDGSTESTAAPGRKMDRNELYQTKHARRVYIGGVENTSEVELRDFLYRVMDNCLGDDERGRHRIIHLYLNLEKKYSFAEFDNIEMATAALELNGIMFKGGPIKVKRPSDYSASSAPRPSRTLEWNFSKMPGLVSNFSMQPSASAPSRGSAYPHGSIEKLRSTSIVPGPHKLYVAGFPYHLEDTDVKELLESFGELRALHLPKDREGRKKGYGFCEYADHNVTSTACAGLNGLAMGEQTLTLRPANNNNHASAAPSSSGANAIEVAVAKQPGDGQVSRILRLGNMVTRQELEDDTEHREIVEDTEEECRRFGQVLRVLIPRNGSGAGMVFVEYANVEEAKLAAKSLGGRKFAERTVAADFFSEEKYARNDFS